MNTQTMQAALIGALHRLMNERDWTQQTLAARAQLSNATVSRILNGRAQPRLDILEKIRVAFELIPPELFLTVETPPIATEPAVPEARVRALLARVEALRHEAELMAASARDIAEVIRPVLHEQTGEISEEQLAKILQLVHSRLRR